MEGQFSIFLKKQTVISDQSLNAPREFWAATGRAVAKVEVELTR